MLWVSVVAIAGVVAAVAAKSQALIATAGFLMFAAIALENAVGYALGYAAARAFGVSRADRRTISIEVGLQNAGLGSTLAAAYLGAAVTTSFWIPRRIKRFCFRSVKRLLRPTVQPC